MSVCVTVMIVLGVLSQARGQDEACQVPTAQMAANSSSLLQVRALTGEVASMHDGDANSNINNDDIEECADETCSHLQGKTYVSGRVASLSETGYQETSKLCCHHEMSLFVQREIKDQGFDVCDVSDLHGFVHWYDCTDDKKTFSGMKNEIAGVMTSKCPWLGHLPNCPKKDPVCGRKAECDPSKFPADSMDGDSAPLDQTGYAGVAKRCCHTEIEKFIRNLINSRSFEVCDEGRFQGFLHWFDCTDDEQDFDKLHAGITLASTTGATMCPWLGGAGEACPPKGHNCENLEGPEPTAHRRRTCPKKKKVTV